MYGIAVIANLNLQRKTLNIERYLVFQQLLRVSHHYATLCRLILINVDAVAGIKNQELLI